MKHTLRHKSTLIGAFILSRENFKSKGLKIIFLSQKTIKVKIIIRKLTGKYLVAIIENNFVVYYYRSVAICGDVFIVRYYDYGCTFIVYLF